ncbi:Rieske 2Fe-2S domain-containing protein [Amycolatopsis sp. NPDC005232]|uniref:Rieske 2Fe-2S domain-containing protein n=1 Tax=Amycolatopsis sp. NPDC005232 TaxID=3157027 RepID=UPI0033B851CB
MTETDNGVVQDSRIHTSTPYRWFTDPDIYAREQERIFRGATWSFLGMAVEIPNTGDYKSTFVGDTPVVMTRTKSGEVVAWVNRCAHRGATVCRFSRGNATKHTCIYHQWSYDAAGQLRGVPFRRGYQEHTGMPEGFDPKQHSLQRLRVEVYHGLVFATFDHSMQSLPDYIGPQMRPWLDRLVAGRELVYLGCTRQYSKSNWKLYYENVKDLYHASLLHLFHTTFNIMRVSMESRTIPDARDGLHSVITTTRQDDDAGADEYRKDGLRSFNEDIRLHDMEVLRSRDEFDEPITNHIQTIFPSLVVQQIHNTMALRQLLPKGPGEFELVFHYFGYSDDDEELRAMRVLQANLVGPAGYISMEDTEATELIQRAAQAAQDRGSTMLLGLDDPVPDERSNISEHVLRSFWAGYRDLMGLKS